MERTRLKRDGFFAGDRTNNVIGYANYILSDVGLTARELVGKTTLDVGAGYRQLEAAMRSSGLPGQVVSIDMNSYDSSAPFSLKTNPGNLLIADVQLGLPILDNSVDLVICHGGPITGGLLDEKGIYPVSESLRVVKAGGEICLTPVLLEAARVINYQKFKAGEEGFSPDEYFEDLLRIYQNPRAYRLEFDQDGIPIPNSQDGELFWSKIEEKYSNQKRDEIYSFAANELTEKLSVLGYSLEANLYQRSIWYLLKIKKIDSENGYSRGGYLSTRSARSRHSPHF